MILTFNTHIFSLNKLHVVSGHRLQYFVKNPELQKFDLDIN